MIKTEIFKNAFYYYQTGQVCLKQETDRAMYFEVGTEGEGDGIKLVTAKKERGILRFFCSCTHVAMKGDKGLPLCAHVIAVIIYMYFHSRRKQK